MVEHRRESEAAATSLQASVLSEMGWVPAGTNAGRLSLFESSSRSANYTDTDSEPTRDIAVA
jgi:hypothetical protein